MTKVEMRASQRYPFTYCADYLRECVGDDYGKGLISRAAAARIKAEIAKILNIDETDLAEQIAEKYIDNYSDD